PTRGLTILPAALLYSILTSTLDIAPLPLHDALPISVRPGATARGRCLRGRAGWPMRRARRRGCRFRRRAGEGGLGSGGRRSCLLPGCDEVVDRDLEGVGDAVHCDAGRGALPVFHAGQVGP